MALYFINSVIDRIQWIDAFNKRKCSNYNYEGTLIVFSRGGHSEKDNRNRDGVYNDATAKHTISFIAALDDQLYVRSKDCRISRRTFETMFQYPLHFAVMVDLLLLCDRQTDVLYT